MFDVKWWLKSKINYSIRDITYEKVPVHMIIRNWVELSQ